MRITQLKIKNFRLLNDLTIDLEQNLSLVIGKNNTGKTSLVHILDKFLNNRGFLFEDFNVNLCTDLISSIETDLRKPHLRPKDYMIHKIVLQVFIEYSDDDDLSDISNLIMDLDPDKNILHLSFEYVLNFERYQQLIGDFKVYQRRINQSRRATKHESSSNRNVRYRHRMGKKKKLKNSMIRNRARSIKYKMSSSKTIVPKDDIRNFIREHQAHYFEIQRFSLDADGTEEPKELGSYA